MMMMARMGKFDSDRDEILWTMTLEGWANESDGNVECPTGYFCLVTNEPAEIPEIAQAFSDVIPEDFDTAELVGNFIVTEDDRGFVSVIEYPGPDSARKAYDMMSAEYSRWAGDDYL